MRKLFTLRYFLFTLTFFVSTFSHEGFGQISLTTLNGSYNQPFDGMGITSSPSYPIGWTGIRFSGSGVAGATLNPITDNGGSVTGSTFNVGTTGAADRALGTLGSGSTVPTFGTAFTNNTTSVINSFSLSGVSEQWKTGSSNTVNEIVLFEYSTNATSLNTGTWTAVTSLNLVELQTASTAAAAIDGNAVANKVAISGSIPSINLGIGSTIWIRWRDADNTGSDGMYALDDFNLSYTNGPVAPPTISTPVNGTNAGEPSSNGSFTINFTPQTTTSTDVQFAFGGSASFGTDYSVSYPAGITNPNASSGILSVPAGTSSVAVTITPLNDITFEGSENVTLTLTIPAGGSQGYILGNASSTLSITDDEVLLFNGTYTQDFNGLASTGTNTWTDNVTVNGWYSSRTSYTANNGNSLAGALYSYGSDATTERALGSVGSGATQTVYYGIRFKNNTEATITNLQVSYTGEQWRNGGAGAAQTVNFAYQTGTSVTSLTAGTFTPVSNLNFTSVVNTGGAATLNGNLSENSADISFNITGLNIAPGQEVMFRWEDIDHAGSDHGLGIDNIIITNQPCTNPTAKPTALTFGTATETSITGSFTAATLAANKYLVVVSTNNALTSDPVNGQVYQTGDNLGDGTVVGYSNSTNFTTTDLSAGTLYYFFVFPVNTACIGGPNYLVTEPLTGSASTDAGLPPCAAPVQQASDLILSNPSINSIQGTFTAADANEYLVVRSLSASLTNEPVNGQTYNAGAVIGNATVVQRSTATSFTANGLAPNTQYYFFVFSLNSQNCLNGPVYNVTSPATGNATTLPLPECITPAAQPSNLTLNSTNNKITGTFNPGTGADSYLVIRSTSSTLSSSPVDNTDYNPGDNIGGGIVVSNNASTSFIETSLSQSTTYYIFIYSNNSNCTGGTKYLTTSPLTGSIATTSTPPNFVYFGNLHSHSDYSDGNKDNPGYTPAQDYAYAKNAECLDFLGISEHNHYSNGDPGNLITTYHQGTIQAENFTAANPGFVAMYGMEWGTISGGGHVVIYGDGMNDLYGWESNVGGISGPNYDVFVQKGDYTGPNGLFKTINDDIATNTFATLAHPNSNDFNNISNTPYNVVADNAIVGTAVESGPAFSTNTTYSNPASSLYYKWYYDKLLAKGYHLGPTVDHDNHNTTFGKTTRSRTAVIAPALNRTEIVKAMREMRFYSTEDCDAVVDFSINTKIMGSIFADRNAPTISASLTDLTTNTSNALIRVKFGIPGSEVLAVTVDSVYGSSLNYVHNDLPINATGYYYIHITNGDAEIITSPIWYTRLCVNTTNNNVVACESYTWPSNGQTYTVSGNYTHSYTDEAGCSNTDNLNLTITHPSTGDTTAIVCDSFTWYGITYTASGTPTRILKGYSGCDSTVTLHLTITHSSSHTTTVSNCESYTWSGPLGNGQTYTESGIYTNVTTNGQGCPHTETLDLTINPKPTVTIPDAYVLTAGVNANTVYYGYAPASTLTVTANPGGGTPGYTYSWSVGSGLSAGATDQSSIQVSPNQAGNYSAQLTVTITDDKGCTATATITVHVIDVRSGNKSDKVTVCHNGNPLIIDGNAVQAHLNHGDNLGACPAIITSARTSNNQRVPAETISGSDKPGLAITGYTLSNYPNPFSTATVIRYHIPVDSKVSLKIYNGLGQVIATLFEGDRRAGSYSINLNAAQLTNGFYYCKLTAFSNQQQFVQSLKLSVGK